MPCEILGEIGCCGSHDISWVEFCYNMVISYIKFILGDPPDGCEIDIFWQDHDLGSYPIIGVAWGLLYNDYPSEYIKKSEALIEKFNDPDFWCKIHPDKVYEELKIFNEDHEDIEVEESEV
jgi:hypothetical protein